jgi:F-type H+-transporting ATPase subunit epsilon
MKKKLEIKIVTPEKISFKGEADSVSISTAEGQITILPNHVPIISLVEPGEIIARNEGKEELLAVGEGLVEVQDNIITLLVDVSERALEIDEKRALEAMEKAKKTMREGVKDEERVLAAEALERSLARLRVVRKLAYRKGRR